MKLYLQILYFTLIAVLLFLFFFFELNIFLTIENINKVKAYFLNLGNLAAVYMVVIYILFNLAAIPRVFFTIFSGYVFGILYGFLFAWIATMLGLIVTFITVRYLFNEKFNTKFGDKQIIKKLNKQIEKQGVFIVIFLRAIYIFPSSILNYSFAFTKIKTLSYIIGSAIGFIPVVLINVYSGYLININISKPVNIYFILFFTIFLFALILFFKKKLLFLNN